jgi:hypothetical protein
MNDEIDVIKRLNNIRSMLIQLASEVLKVLELLNSEKQG